MIIRASKYSNTQELFRKLKILKVAPLLIFLLRQGNAFSQSATVHDYNQLGWYQLNVNIDFHKHWGWHGDYNQRYEKIGKDLFQRLFRTGVVYKPNEALQFHAGYVWVENQSYGDFPMDTQGFRFNEHRIYQSAYFQHKTGHLELRHRVVAEQRWLERKLTNGQDKAEQYSFANRARYQLRLQYSFRKSLSVRKYPFIAAYDEVLVSFGKSIKNKNFDQNRIGFLAGYKFNKSSQLEIGYIYIKQQLQRKYQDKDIMLHNNVFQLNLISTISVGQKKSGT